MVALTTINHSLSAINEKQYSLIIEKARNLRKSYKVGITDEDLLYVMAQNTALGRELNQVRSHPIVDSDYLSKISDTNVLLNNMFLLPDTAEQLFASRSQPFVIFSVDEKDSDYLENLRQKIYQNLGQISANVVYSVKVYVNVGDMVLYQSMVKRIRDFLPQVEIVSHMPLSDQFDNTTMLAVPTEGEANKSLEELFSTMAPCSDKFLLMKVPNSLGKQKSKLTGRESGHYYKLRKFLGDTIYAHDGGGLEQQYTRNLVYDYFFSDYLTVAERFRHIFKCPSLIQLGEYFFVPCYIKHLEVHASVISVNKEMSRLPLVITEECTIERVDERELERYLRKNNRFIDFSLVKINGEDYFVQKYTVKLHTICLSNYGIGEMTYSMTQTLQSAVRFLTSESGGEAYVAATTSYGDFRETVPHPLTREMIVREVRKDAKKGIWAERNSGTNFSTNLGYIQDFISVEELLKTKRVCPLEGFLEDVVYCAWR